MKNGRNIFIVLSLIGVACQEPYYDSNLDASERIPCVEATIYTTNQPKALSLYYARPYNDNNTEEITNATVMLTDTRGTNFLYTPNAEGYYLLADENFSPGIGESYQLQIQMPDGSVVKSYPQEFLDTLGIRKGHFIIYDERKIYSKSTDGKTQITKEKGLGCYVIINPEVTTKKYFRLRSDFLLNYTTHSIYSREFDSIIEVDGRFVNYHFIETADTLLDNYKFTIDANYPVIGKIEPGVTYSENDLKHLVNFFDNNYKSIDGFMRWIVFLDVVTINQQTYEYYKKVNNLLNEPFRIYDPVPEQISGNLYNETDSSKLVLGNFEVASINTRMYEIYLDQVWQVLVIHEITDSSYARYNKVFKSITYDTISFPLPDTLITNAN